MFVGTLVLFSSIVSAQIKIGGTLGIGGTTQAEFCDIYDNSNLIPRYFAGLTVKDEFNNWFALKGNLNYGKKGSIFDVKENGQTFEQKQRLDYLTIPVKAEFSAPVKNSKFFFATGPYLGILLDADKEVNGMKTDNKDLYKNTDYGMAFELGLIKPVAKADLIFSVNYDMGFTKISEIDCEINNKALTFNFGLLF